MSEGSRFYEIRTVKEGLEVNSKLLKLAWCLAGTIALVFILLVSYLWVDNRLTSIMSIQSAAVSWPVYALLALAAVLCVGVVTVFTRRKLDLEAQLALLQIKPHES